MVNLLVMGKAISNLHDGDFDFGGTTLKGIHETSDIGQLSLFEHYGHLKIGQYLKNPRYPIWVVCSESHYTVLFSLSNPNELFYYDGLAGQTEEIRLTLEPSQAVSHESPLEFCIRTRWTNAHVNWNGSEIIL